MSDALKKDVILLVGRAMDGEGSVWGDIYEKTHRYVYYLALKSLRSEQDAQDVTQEIFIQAISHIAQLQRAENFYAWLRSIVFSKCINAVNKKKPILLDDHEDGGSYLDSIPETDEEFLPEYVLDKAETRRMVLDLVDELPYLQKQTILYFYYDGMTVEEIASLMECASGTVKSRLNYARQQIRKGVEEHERKGVRLYSMGTLPIMAILLREQAESIVIPEALATAIGSILTSASGVAASGAGTGITAGAATAEAGAGAGTAASAAATASATAVPTGAALSVKIIAIIVASALAIGGGILVLTNNVERNTPAPPPITEQAEASNDASQVGSVVNDTTQTPENAEPTTPDDAAEADPSAETPEWISYYDTLSYEQKQLLSRMEEAVLAIDYQTAYTIQQTTEFRNIIEECPDDTYYDSLKAFFYFRSDGIAVQPWLYRFDDATHYYFSMFVGNSEEGRILEAQYAPYFFSFHETPIKDGKATGPLIQYRFEPEHPFETGFYTFRGNLLDGFLDGPYIDERYGDVHGPDGNGGFWGSWPEWVDAMRPS